MIFSFGHVVKIEAPRDWSIDSEGCYLDSEDRLNEWLSNNFCLGVLDPKTRAIQSSIWRTTTKELSSGNYEIKVAFKHHSDLIKFRLMWDLPHGYSFV